MDYYTIFFTDSDEVYDVAECDMSKGYNSETIATRCATYPTDIVRVVLVKRGVGELAIITPHPPAHLLVGDAMVFEPGAMSAELCSS